MPECPPGFRSEGAGLKQRVFHASYLLLHGAQGVAYHSRSYPLGAQLTQLAQLQEIKERVRFGNRKESCLFPARQLPSRDAQDSQYVRSLVSFH